MPQFSAEEKREKTEHIIELSAKAWSDCAIGREVEIDRRTVKKLREDELASRAEHRSASNDRERAIATYEAIIVHGWERLAALKDARSYNVSGLLNSIKAAQERIDKLSGAEAPVKFKDETDEPYDIVFDDDEVTSEATG